MGHKSITQSKSSCTGSIKFTEIIKISGLIIFLGGVGKLQLPYETVGARMVKIQHGCVRVAPIRKLGTLHIIIF